MVAATVAERVARVRAVVAMVGPGVVAILVAATQMAATQVAATRVAILVAATMAACPPQPCAVAMKEL